jgi:hypothetical protein
MEHLAQRQLHERVGDSTNPAGRARDEAHLQECPHCARQLQELQDVWDAMGSWRVQPAADMTQRIVQAALERGATGGRQHRARAAGWVWARRAAAIAASIVIGMSLGFLSGRNGTRHGPPAPTPADPVGSAAVAAGNLAWFKSAGYKVTLFHAFQTDASGITGYIRRSYATSMASALRKKCYPALNHAGNFGGQMRAEAFSNCRFGGRGRLGLAKRETLLAISEANP